MKLRVAAIALTLRYAVSQTCTPVKFELTDITGPCNYDVLLHEYTRQVFDEAGATCSTNQLSAKEDLDNKLMAATGADNGPDGADLVCKAMYDNADETPFWEAADRGTDMHFEQMFYNGRSDWQEEVETIYESADGSATSVLREDAAKVREFYRGDGSYSRVSWPNMLTNFDDSTCASHAAMCCWPKDRQANDGNGNCATPYDENCVNKDPADNTNLCFTDLAKGDMSTGFNSSEGFVAFPEDNNNGEGAIHCHGFAWADDEYDPISRYKANNLFFVSMYDHMHQRGYVENVPGAPMCGCMEQMPVATRSDCTQVDLTEDWSMVFDGAAFTGRLDKVEVDFNACQGRNNRNNDLWAYAARLYDEGRMTRHQFGAVGRVLTNDGDCYHATEYEKAKKGFVTAYTHNETMYTKVAGRDDMKTAEPYGREAFNRALFEQSLTKPSDLEVAEFPVGERPIIMRICPDCTDTHKYIWYARKTPVGNPNFDLLHSILYRESSSAHPENTWREDFELYSSYEDAVTGANPWQCPGDAFNYNKPFTGNCSPDGTKVTNQHSNWLWYRYPGPRPNVAYYVNKPEAVGISDYSDNASHTKAAGFSDIDIGDVGMPGNTLEADGIYHITGSGADIGGQSDSFHYKSQQWEGDIDVKVHLTDFANNGGYAYAKAGLLLRSDESVDATYAFALLTYNDGIKMQYRKSKGNWASSSGSKYKTSPAQKSAWLRIVKKMENIEFYRSEDGIDWTLHGTEQILFPDNKYRVGLAVTSRKNDYLAEATFANYEVATYEFPTAAPSVSSAPTPWQPLVDIGNPQRDGNFYVSGTSEVVQGSGVGIWGSSDMFAFYNTQEANGDFSVEMLIDKFEYGTEYARGGLMIRDSNDPDSANVFVGAAGNRKGVICQSRATTGASTVHHGTRYVNYYNNFWVKLSKEGTVVTAYYKVNAEDEWIDLGNMALTHTGSTIQVGRAVTAANDYYNALATMTTSNYVIV